MIKGYIELNFKCYANPRRSIFRYKRLFPIGSFIAIRDAQEDDTYCCEIRYISGEYIGICIETYEQVKSLIIKASRGKNNEKIKIFL